MKEMARELISPLRYPGGKGKMAGVFKRLIEENDLLDGKYILAQQGKKKYFLAEV